MRLVIEYSVGDGCTYSCTETVPVEYSSPEAFAVDFEQFCLSEHASTVWPRRVAIFAGRSWNVDDFFADDQFWAPGVMTVDEWFERTSVSDDLAAMINKGCEHTK
jgi:hypothetical protein